MAAHDVQQLEEALALLAALGPAAPIRASPSDDSPAPAMGSMTPDKLPKSIQADSPTISTASDEPATLLDEEEARGDLPGVSSQAEAVPSSPVEAHNSPQGVKEAARPAVPAASIQVEAVTSSPQSLKDGVSPVSHMEELSPARAPTAGSANTPAGAMATITDKAAAEAMAGVPSAIEPASQHVSLAATAVSIITAGAELPIPEAIAAGTDKAAVPPAIDSASQPMTPVTTEPTPPELTDTAPAQTTAGVPPAVADASLEFEEEEAGHAAEVHAAGALQGKGSETRPSATITEAAPNASTEGKAAPKSPSAHSEANAEPSTHAAEGFTDNRAAADSPEADIRANAMPATPLAKIQAKATSNGPAAEFSATETIAAKHAVGSSTMLKNLASSSSAQAKSQRQIAKSKAAAQTPASAAAAAASSAIAPAKSDSKSVPALTAAAGSANIVAAASAVSNPAAADAASLGSSVSSSKVDGNVVALTHAGNRLDPVHAPGSAVSITDHADATATKSAAALLAVDPAVDPAAAVPALEAADSAAAKPAVSKLTATEAFSSAASALGGHAAAAAPHPAQPGAEPKSVSGSSVGNSEGEYEVVAGADYLQQLKNPKKRRLSGGATCVVNL